MPNITLSIGSLRIDDAWRMYLEVNAGEWRYVSQLEFASHDVAYSQFMPHLDRLVQLGRRSVPGDRAFVDTFVRLCGLVALDKLPGRRKPQLNMHVIGREA